MILIISITSLLSVVDISLTYLLLLLFHLL